MDKNQGELSLIRLIRKRFPKKRKEILKGIGDDAMVFRNGFVISTDSFFENIHFDLKYFSMYALGCHTMAASLSDLAAMGALPVCCLVSLNLTKYIGVKDIEQLYNGFEKMAKRYKFDIAGGDVVTSPGFGMTITVIGRTRKSLMRSGAKPGQALFITNFLGLAEVGRSVLKYNLPQKEYQDAVNKHLFPEPRINEAQSIQQYATSCIDTSDGLSTDAIHLAEESRVKIVIDSEHIPIHSEVGEFCSIKKIDPLQFILSAGEDFELLFTARRLPGDKFQVPRTKNQNSRTKNQETRTKKQGPKLKIFKIGRVMKGRGVYVSERGKEKRIEPTGYEHLM
ncbi:thiamine-phosphate kinase [candidate division WOR-3 bacterium]|nr:thiamine-phosphate kinase [candidate division WOR-3 bacterium]